MASEKISNLTPHTPNVADLIPVANGGANFSDTVGGIIVAAVAAATPPSLTFIVTTYTAPGTVAFLTDLALSSPFIPSTSPTSVTIPGHTILNLDSGLFGSIRVETLDISGLPDLKSFTYESLLI